MGSSGSTTARRRAGQPSRVWCMTLRRGVRHTQAEQIIFSLLRDEMAPRDIYSNTEATTNLRPTSADIYPSSADWSTQGPRDDLCQFMNDFIANSCSLQTTIVFALECVVKAACFQRIWLVFFDASSFTL